MPCSLAQEQIQQLMAESLVMAFLLHFAWTAVWSKEWFRGQTCTDQSAERHSHRASVQIHTIYTFKIWSYETQPQASDKTQVCYAKWHMESSDISGVKAEI